MCTWLGPALFFWKNWGKVDKKLCKLYHIACQFCSHYHNQDVVNDNDIWLVGFLWHLELTLRKPDAVWTKSTHQREGMYAWISHLPNLFHVALDVLCKLALLSIHKCSKILLFFYYFQYFVNPCNLHDNESFWNYGTNTQFKCSPP